jgi:hypothetical protein
MIPEPFMRRLLFAVAFLVPALAHADDFTDQLDEAKKAYAKGDYATAGSALDSASGIIRERRVEMWKKTFPEPLSGWTATAPTGESMGAAMFGGATTVSRTYKKGEATIEIALMTDSPMMAMMTGMMSGMGGAMMGGDSGVKQLVIDGRKVIYDKNESSYMTSIANKVMVTVKGSDADDASLRDYLKAIKYAEIEKLTAK